MTEEELKAKGGFAFPSQPFSNGMTLRDNFAAQAMVAFIERADAFNTSIGDALAASAYRMADAMLKERAK